MKTLSEIASGHRELAAEILGIAASGSVKPSVRLSDGTGLFNEASVVKVARIQAAENHVIRSGGCVRSTKSERVAQYAATEQFRVQ